jgi:GNAT superfamily N-acetyltransferase
MLTLIRQAALSDTPVVVDILGEASRWLEERGKSMWQAEELSADRIAIDVAAGLFFIGEREGQSACTLRFQLSDPLFWPDVPEGQSAFIHRLALRRQFAGGGVSSAVIRWAALRARSLGRAYLRLDCEASRPSLRAIYERLGFVHHSDRQVGPYFVARYVLDVLNVRDGQSTHPAGEREKSALEMNAGALGGRGTSRFNKGLS